MIEKVNPSHPDKVADRIAGAIVDLAYKKDNNPKIAVEVLIGHGICHIICETSVKILKSDVKNIVNKIVGKVDTIQSVDSLNIAAEIGKRSLEAGVITKVLLEVNVGDS